MPLPSAFALKVAAPLVLGMVLASGATQTKVMDVLGSQTCQPDDANGGSFEFASASAHGGHGTTARRGTKWQTPYLTTFDREKSTVSFELLPARGDHVVARHEVRAVLKIRDSATGLPVSGRSIAGWMLLRRNAQVSAELSCAAKARLFSQGRVTARPDVDLNARQMLVLDRTGSISVVDPQVDFTITQMQKVIPLPGAAADWALSANGETLLVSIPAFGAVVAINTTSYQIANLIELGKGTLPSQMTALPDGRIAVFLSGLGTIAIVDADDNKPPVLLPFGRGDIALEAGKSGSSFAAGSGDKLQRIELASGRVVAEATMEGPSPSLALSRTTEKLFVASASSSVVRIFDAQSLKSVKSIFAEPGISTLAMTPDGLSLLVANRQTDELMLIDASSGDVLDRQHVARAPVEVTFTADYAYVRGLGGDHFTIVELAELAKGKIVPVDVQSASRAFPPREALSHARLVAPYGHGALVANPDERVAYYYMEGMNTPMGTVGIYTPQAQGILTIDRGFRETEPGTYEASAVMPFSGTYDIPVEVDAEDNVQCFSASVEAAPDAETVSRKSSIAVVAKAGPGPKGAHSRTILVQLRDTIADKPVTGVRDVRLLAFSSSGSWQAHQWARETDDGQYAVDWSFPKTGRYGISVSTKSKNISFADQSPIYLSIGVPVSADSASERKTSP